MKPVQGIPLVLLAAFGCWATPSLAQGQTATIGIYACTDAQGRRITADRPITECIDRDQRVLGHTGVELRRVGPTLTERERDEQDAQRRIKQQQLSKQWFDELLASSPLDSITAYKGAMLVVHGDKDTVIMPEENANVVAAYPAASIVLVPEADHGYGFYSDQPEVSALVEGSFAKFFADNLK